MSSTRTRFSSYAVVVLALVMLGGLYTALAAPKGRADDGTNQSIAVKEGRQLYLQGCSTCHGLNNAGGAGGPSLIGVGASAVVFQVSSGRMPLANGAAQAPRKKAKYDRTETDQLAAYIQSLGGGPTVPSGNLEDGDLAMGGDLFRTNCSSCHNFAGAGGALTRSKYAPALDEATAREIYAAMQSGPENMPRFSDNQLTPDEKRAIVKYVRFITHDAKDPGGAALGRLGPIPEGLVIFLVGIGVLVVAALWIGAPSMSDSIRDRLSSPSGPGGQNDGGDSSTSDLTTSDFVQTDSRSSHGATQTVASTHAAPPSEPNHAGVGSSGMSERGAELAVSALFLLSLVGVIGFIVCYIAVPFDYGKANYEWYTPALGVFMTLALVGVGAGAVLWAKTLMVDEETVQERHHMSSTDESKAETAALLKQGLADSGLPRRKVLGMSMLIGAGSLAILPIPLVFSLAKFQHKERTLSKTSWKAGSRLLDELGRPVKLGDLEIGGVKSVFPDVPGGRRAADSAALLIRMKPEDLRVKESRKDWVQDGHIVYSVICTHLGCPVKLYEQQTHHLFCPCHQSTFDAANGAKVLFGPAARSLPQLAISVDADGYFVAQGDFTEPVGPSFWERKPSYSDKVGK